jgi:hypothetical protein
MIDYVLNFQFNSLLGVYLYWLPLALCVIGYTARTWLEYRKELRRREDCVKINYSYFPDLTVGVILGRVFCAVTPGFNILALVFSVGGPMLASVFEFFGSLFRIPLVRPYRK